MLLTSSYQDCASSSSTYNHKKEIKEASFVWFNYGERFLTISSFDFNFISSWMFNARNGSRSTKILSFKNIWLIPNAREIFRGLFGVDLKCREAIMKNRCNSTQVVRKWFLSLVHVFKILKKFLLHSKFYHVC